MAVKNLTDPILRDIVRLLIGAGPLTAGTLSGAAKTRYLTHLERIDGELVAFRQQTGNVALAVNEEVVKISSARLATIEGELAQLRTALLSVTAQAQQLDADGQELAALKSALFEEFGEDLARVDGGTATEIAIGLLRLWRPTAEKTGEPVTPSAGDAHEATDPEDARAAAGDLVRGPQRAAGAGPGGRRARG